MDNQKRTKYKNNKILTWQQENAVADTLPCSICSALSNKYSLEEIHEGLWHAWVTRLLQYVCSKNLPFSTDEVRKVCNTCQVCAEIKPQFYKKRDDVLIKAINPIEQLVQISRSPQKFNSKQVFSCSNQWVFLVSICFSMFGYGDMNCLDSLFALCGTAGYVHSDRGPLLIPEELHTYPLRRGIASCHSALYNPHGNGQDEHYVQTVSKSMLLSLKTHNPPSSEWQKPYISYDHWSIH